MKNKLSIIVPTYNSEKYLQKCLDSIINQTSLPNNYEIIVVDDGSNDNTREIIEEYSNKFKEISYYFQKNQKQSSARNNGLKNATGEYILFVDSDDELKKNMISSLLTQIKGNDLAVCGIEKKFIINKMLVKRIEENLPHFAKAKNVQDLITIFLTKNLECDVGLWNKLFKANIIYKNKIIFSNKNFFEDSLFVLQYLLAIDPLNIGYISEPLYILYKRSNSTTTMFNKNIDNLSDDYLRKVAELLKETSFNTKEIMYGLELRLALHVSHHHILYDNNWNKISQKSKLKALINYRILFSNSILIKHKLALITMYNFFPIYCRLYKKFKYIKKSPIM